MPTPHLDPAATPLRCTSAALIDNALRLCHMHKVLVVLLGDEAGRALRQI